MTQFVEDTKKSLNENINILLKSDLSRSAKSRALVEVLGLSKREASYFMGTLPAMPKAERKVFAFKFGIELEMLCDHMAVRDGLNRAGIGYNWAANQYYHTNNNTGFEFKHDGSIHMDSATNIGFRGAECVSPVLSSKGGLDRVKAVCRVLNESGAQVNKSTGFHIHLSTEGMTDEWFVNVFKNYQRLEKVIDGFMAPSRRFNRYCKSLANVNFDSCRTIWDVQRVMREDRYHKVNPMAYSAHGTIEFRQHSGTTNFEKISMWLSFCSKLVEYSKSHL